MIILPQSFKEGIKKIISKHFDENLQKRFTVLYEGDYLNVNEDRSLWQERKKGLIVAEIYFDNEYICEANNQMDKKWVEYRLLQNFKEAYKSGKINLTKEGEDLLLNQAKVN